MGRLLVSWGHKVASRLRAGGSDRGAGFVEYAGLLLLIVAIVAAVLALNLDDTIADGIANIVGEVIG